MAVLLTRIDIRVVNGIKTNSYTPVQRHRYSTAGLESRLRSDENKQVCVRSNIAHDGTTRHGMTASQLQFERKKDKQIEKPARVVIRVSFAPEDGRRIQHLYQNGRILYRFMFSFPHKTLGCYSGEIGRYPR
jgi:hypothetical protein